MKLIQIAIVFFITTNVAFGSNPFWGPTGHRTVSKIAEKHLKRKVKRKIKKLLNGESLAFASTYADEIKSDKNYRKFSAWHYVNFPFDKTYEESEKSSRGDLNTGIKTCIKIIKNKTSLKKDKIFYLKLLVHLMGDLHQPLHIGRAEDRGGNDIRVKWHGKKTNLHHVWDEDLINKWDMSYRELADNAKILTKNEIKAIQSGTVIDWINETRILTKEVYKSANEKENLRWDYSYNHFGVVRTQLQKGGLRLAKILNEIFE